MAGFWGGIVGERDYDGRPGFAVESSLDGDRKRPRRFWEDIICLGGAEGI